MSQKAHCVASRYTTDNYIFGAFPDLAAYLLATIALDLTAEPPVEILQGNTVDAQSPKTESVA